MDCQVDLSLSATRSLLLLLLHLLNSLEDGGHKFLLICYHFPADLWSLQQSPWWCCFSRITLGMLFTHFVIVKFRPRRSVVCFPGNSLEYIFITLIRMLHRIGFNFESISDLLRLHLDREIIGVYEHIIRWSTYSELWYDGIQLRAGITMQTKIKTWVSYEVNQFPFHANSLLPIVQSLIGRLLYE